MRATDLLRAALLCFVLSISAFCGPRCHKQTVPFYDLDPDTGAVIGVRPQTLYRLPITHA